MWEACGNDEPYPDDLPQAPPVAESPVAVAPPCNDEQFVEEVVVDDDDEEAEEVDVEADDDNDDDSSASAVAANVDVPILEWANWLQAGLVGSG